MQASQKAMKITQIIEGEQLGLAILYEAEYQLHLEFWKTWEWSASMPERSARLIAMHNADDLMSGQNKQKEYKQRLKEKGYVKDDDV